MKKNGKIPTTKKCDQRLANVCVRVGLERRTALLFQILKRKRKTVHVVGWRVTTVFRVALGRSTCRHRNRSLSSGRRPRGDDARRIAPFCKREHYFYSRSISSVLRTCIAANLISQLRKRSISMMKRIIFESFFFLVIGFYRSNVSFILFPFCNFVFGDIDLRFLQTPFFFIPRLP